LVIKSKPPERAVLHIMICKSCRQEKKLIKAHIYPEWVYKALYPNGKIEGSSLILISSNKPEAKRVRIGLYDPSILCSACDNHIGTLDAVGKKAFIETELSLFRDLVDKGRVYTIKNIDPAQLKNFLLSLLLRAHFSGMEEYQNVHLLAPQAERLQEIVMNNIETETHEFSVLITKFRAEKLKHASEKISLAPYRNTIDGIEFVTINLVGGFKILIKIDSKLTDAALLPFILRPDYPIYVIEHEQFETSPELNWFASKKNSTRRNPPRPGLDH
jgi:hypothetical protein